MKSWLWCIILEQNKKDLTRKMKNLSYDFLQEVSSEITFKLQEAKLISALDQASTYNNPVNYNFEVQDIITDELCKQFEIKNE